MLKKFFWRLELRKVSLLTQSFSGIGMIKYKVWLAVKLMTTFGEVQTILKRLSFRNLGFNTSPEELESFKYLGRNAVHKNDCIYLDQKLYIEESKEVQGLTAGIHHIHTYTKFYWRMHEFVYAHIDMYTHFSLWFLNCSIFFIFFFVVLVILYCLETYCYIYDI